MRSHCTTLESGKGWLARSERSRQQDISQLVGRFGFHTLEVALFGTRKQPIDRTRVIHNRPPNETIVARVKAFCVKLLTWSDIVLLSQFRWQQDLPFGRDGCLHTSKITSYFPVSRRSRLTHRSEEQIQGHLLAPPLERTSSGQAVRRNSRPAARRRKC